MELEDNPHVLNTMIFALILIIIILNDAGIKMGLNVYQCLIVTSPTAPQHCTHAVSNVYYTTFHILSIMHSVSSIYAMHAGTGVMFRQLWFNTTNTLIHLQFCTHHSHAESTTQCRAGAVQCCVAAQHSHSG